MMRRVVICRLFLPAPQTSCSGRYAVQQRQSIVTPQSDRVVTTVAAHACRIRVNDNGEYI